MVRTSREDQGKLGSREPAVPVQAELRVKYLGKLLGDKTGRSMRERRTVRGWRECRS